ncbi:MAG: glycosyltransferase [Hyphomicrobiaceae bacterium]
MPDSGDASLRLLIYSHDSFGLGHLSRCRAIAHSIVDHRSDISVLILSGLPLIGSYAFKPRVDFIRFPGVVKLKNGSYTARGLDVSIEDAIAIRESLIRCAAETFRPHMFLVDKEPLGLRGEVENTLRILKGKGTRLVLGLRDIMDDPDYLKFEWDRKEVIPALTDLYDDIWIYGRQQIYDPLAGIEVAKVVRDKITYTGYLRRGAAGPIVEAGTSGSASDEPSILVTTGGGGDGAELIDWVLSAYEHDRSLPYRAYIVLGPFMPADLQARFKTRAERLPKVQVTTFIASLDKLMRRSLGVIAMGGYNTFCEILSYDKPAVIVPRTRPRLEQKIRAERMQELGLVRMLDDDGNRHPARMAQVIRSLPAQPRPSHVQIPGLLDGFESINQMVDNLLGREKPLPRERILALNDV